MRKVLSYLYTHIPFKSVLFTFIKSIWLPSEGLLKHLHFKGEITVSLPEGKSFKMQHYGYMIENEIFWKGIDNAWEKKSLAVWMELCKTSFTIMDIGANTGLYALIAKTINPNAIVYAFEPVKRVFEKLQYNCALNNFDIIAQPHAISNADGFADIYDSSEEHVLSVSLNKNFNTAEKLIPVTVGIRKLDSLVESQNIPRIDLIKIDTETHEPEVLEGYTHYLPMHKPSILIEILNDEIATKIEKIISGMGYLYFNIDEQNPPKQVSKLTKSNYYNFFLCSEETAQKLKLL
jgi:FkbM family methyltransferase